MSSLASKICKEFKHMITGTTGGSTTARYCYSVWLRHLSLAHKNGLGTPRVVAELGPGDSLGVGMAALLSGAEKYFAFDVLKYSSQERNLKIMDELVELFKQQAPIPNQREFPNVKPYLDSYAFPKDILPEEKLAECLSMERIDAIQEALVQLNSQNLPIEISYQVPWNNSDIITPDSVDMIYSQAVMEHVSDLRGAYKSMSQWLRQGGFISHQIDFRCHGTSLKWNGHWKYGDGSWTIIQALQKQLIPVRWINREPCSKHLEIIQDLGFDVVGSQRNQCGDGMSRNKLAPRFKSLTDEDFATSGLFVQAVKR